MKYDEEAPVVTEDEAFNASTSLHKHSMPILGPNDIVGRAFLIPQEDVQRLRARIVKAIDDHDGKLQRDCTRLKLIFSAKDDRVEDAFTYNEILDHINSSEDDNLIEWNFKSITSHEGPLPRSHPTTTVLHATW